MQDHATWDNHIIDYWVWRGDHLVPATPDDSARMEEDEGPRRASRRLAYLRVRDPGKARRMRRRRNVLIAPLMWYPPLVTPWLLAMRPHRRIAHEEGAHAEQSVTG
jgi:hypothetical protein